MYSRTPRLTLTLALLIVVAVLVPARVANAGTEPPFQLVFPQEITKTVFSSTFGARRSGGRRHHGNDLLAPKLTEVYAAADGVVVDVGVNALSGRHITIEHVDGWTTHYVHLNNDNPGTDDGQADWSLTLAPGVELGSPVVAGQVIGWVGDSGNAETTTSHTHFELRHDGVAVDPYDLLRAAYLRDGLSARVFADRIAEGLTLLVGHPLVFDYEIV